MNIMPRSLVVDEHVGLNLPKQPWGAADKAGFHAKAVAKSATASLSIRSRYTILLVPQARLCDRTCDLSVALQTFSTSCPPAIP